MSIEAQAWVYRYSEARLADRLVLLAIADEADDDGTNAFPSQRRIADKAKVGQSTVRRCIANLERSGELLVTRPETTGRGKFSTYELPMRLPEKGAEIEHLPGDEKRAGTRRNAPPMSGADPLTPRPLDQETPGLPPSQRRGDPRADEITRAWWDAQSPKPMQKFVAVRGIVKTALNAGWEPADVARALDRIDSSVVSWKLEQELKRRAPSGGWDPDEASRRAHG